MLSKDQWQAEQERLEEEQDEQEWAVSKEEEWNDLVAKCNKAFEKVFGVDDERTS